MLLFLFFVICRSRICALHGCSNALVLLLKGLPSLQVGVPPRLLEDAMAVAKQLVRVSSHLATSTSTSASAQCFFNLSLKTMILQLRPNVSIQTGLAIRRDVYPLPRVLPPSLVLSR